MDTPNSEPASELDPQDETTQKLIRKITRGAAIVFLIGGILLLALGENMILGAALTLIGLTDIVFVPRILETIITAKLKQRNDKG